MDRVVVLSARLEDGTLLMDEHRIQVADLYSAGFYDLHAWGIVKAVRSGIHAHDRQNNVVFFRNARANR